jgi:hypothetical protein
MPASGASHTIDHNGTRFIYGGELLALGDSKAINSARRNGFANVTTL